MIAKIIEHNGEAVLLFPPEFTELADEDEVELEFLPRVAGKKLHVVVRKVSA